MRQAAPKLWFLAPGVGAQGGDLGDALRNGLRADGLGMLLTVSRSIARAGDPRQAVIDLNAAVRQEQEHFLAQAKAPAAAAAAVNSRGCSTAQPPWRKGCCKPGACALASSPSSRG